MLTSPIPNLSNQHVSELHLPYQNPMNAWELIFFGSNKNIQHQRISIIYFLYVETFCVNQKTVTKCIATSNCFAFSFLSIVYYYILVPLWYFTLHHKIMQQRRWLNIMMHKTPPNTSSIVLWCFSEKNGDGMTWKCHIHLNSYCRFSDLFLGHQEFNCYNTATQGRLMHVEICSIRSYWIQYTIGLVRNNSLSEIHCIFHVSVCKQQLAISTLV